jgi:hypothetical protein
MPFGQQRKEYAIIIIGFHPNVVLFYCPFTIHISLGTIPLAILCQCEWQSHEGVLKEFGGEDGKEAN